MSKIRFKRLIVMLLVAILVQITILNVRPMEINEVKAASVVIQQIPNTNRTFSDYNESFMSVTGFAFSGCTKCVEVKNAYKNSGANVQHWEKMEHHPKIGLLKW
jgi:hypothetical protein